MNYHGNSGQGMGMENMLDHAQNYLKKFYGHMFNLKTLSQILYTALTLVADVIVHGIFFVEKCR